MGATLDALYRLQSIDQQLRSTRDRIESKRRNVRTIERRITLLERDIQQNHLQSKQAQAEADRHELDRKTREEHTLKLREALNHSRTNKEYAAVLAELNTQKADVVKVEETVLAAMTKAEELQTKEAELKETLEKEQTRLATAQEAVQAMEDELSGEIQDLEKKRAEAASGITPDAFECFNRAADQNDGDAMAGVQRTHPKRHDYICGGCNMAVPLELVNALQTRDEIQHCKVCLRILYLEAPAGVTV